jgi:hypothetical protein
MKLIARQLLVIVLANNPCIAHSTFMMMVCSNLYFVFYEESFC